MDYARIADGFRQQPDSFSSERIEPCPMMRRFSVEVKRALSTGIVTVRVVDISGQLAKFLDGTEAYAVIMSRDSFMKSDPDVLATALEHAHRDLNLLRLEEARCFVAILEDLTANVLSDNKESQRVLEPTNEQMEENR